MVRRRFPPGILLAIALGAAAGSLLRAAIAYWLPPGAGGWPWATFLVNVAGSAVVGFVVITAIERAAPSIYLRALLGTGVCGGLTTFSTWMVEVCLLIKNGHPGTAVGYVFASLAAGLVAARLGVIAARTAWKPAFGHGRG
jgi:fluoride exporter